MPIYQYLQRIFSILNAPNNWFYWLWVLCYKNFMFLSCNTEIIGRKDYLYNVFKLYFVIKKTVYLKGNFTLPQYYILESIPFNSMNNFYVVVGDTNFVIEYINTHKEEFNGKTLVIITCVKNNKNNIIEKLNENFERIK